MSVDPTIQGFVKQLEETLELEHPLFTQTDGIWILPADEHVNLTISAMNPGYSFHAVFALLPQNNEDLLARIMEANTFGQTTEGAIIGLDAEAKHLTLALETKKPTDYKEFERELEGFLTALEYWRTQTKKS